MRVEYKAVVLTYPQTQVASLDRLTNALDVHANEREGDPESWRLVSLLPDPNSPYARLIAVYERSTRKVRVNGEVRGVRG